MPSVRTPPRQTMTIICSTRMTTRTPAWPSASSSAARSRWFPRSWRRPGFRARTPICSLSTALREISRSTACSVGGGDPSSPMPRNYSAPIPKEACERYRLVTISVVDLDCGLLTSLARDRAETGPCRIGAMATKNVARRRRRRCLRWGRARWRFGTACFVGFAGRRWREGDRWKKLISVGKKLFGE